jgi:hypothetical protein
MQRFAHPKSLILDKAIPLMQGGTMRGFSRILFAGAALALTITSVVVAESGNVQPQPLDRAAALTVFERIKKLEGTWQATSTKGWEERQQFRLIARGTAVVSQSAPGPSANVSKGGNAPSAAMLTVFHMDGDRLLLTHYCEAGNQPRMIATGVEEVGHSVRFTFLDGTNMASRTTGHMHSVVMTFVDDNHFNERWSWYEKGKEQWMETVHNERIRSTAGRP